MYNAFFNKVSSRINSENIGGLVSFCGSLCPLASGDIQSVAAAIAFAAAETGFMLRGHTAAGYSLGALGFAAGDIVLATSEAVSGNPALQASLLMMGAAWGIGTLRAPLERLASTERLAPAFRRAASVTARLIPPIVGSSCLATRLPGLGTALASGNYVIASAIGLWGISDVLCGRLQSHAASVLAWTRNILKPEM